jgi:hypothetical protein
MARRLDCGAIGERLSRRLMFYYKPSLRNLS